MKPAYIPIAILLSGCAYNVMPESGESLSYNSARAYLEDNAYLEYKAVLTDWNFGNALKPTKHLIGYCSDRNGTFWRLNDYDRKVHISALDPPSYDSREEDERYLNRHFGNLVCLENEEATDPYYFARIIAERYTGGDYPSDKTVVTATVLEGEEATNAYNDYLNGITYKTSRELERERIEDKAAEAERERRAARADQERKERELLAVNFNYAREPSQAGQTVCTGPSNILGEVIAIEPEAQRVNVHVRYRLLNIPPYGLFTNEYRQLSSSTEINAVEWYPLQAWKVCDWSID